MSVCLVLLAGGKSSRMGQPKGLLQYGNKYWIEEQIERFDGIGGAVYVGLGFDFQHYFEAVPWLKLANEQPLLRNGIYIRVFINPEPELGPFSTLQMLLSKSNDHQRYFIQPIDVPLPDKESLLQLLQNENEVVLPAFRSQKGHPVLISSSFRELLLSVQKDDDLARLDKQIEKLAVHQKTLVPISNHSILVNINTQQEWQNFIQSI